MSSVDFDVGIIGGGPAGAAMGAYLARAGVKCAIVESAIFPRPHVGESLVPATTRVFKELGFLEEMDRRGFVRKYGATWSSPTGKARPYQVDWDGLDDDCNAAIRFDERPQEGVEQNYTYHVDRGEFDLAFLQHAHQAGATVYEGVAVRGVDLDTSDPELVLKMGRRETRLSVRMVVDASGRKTVLGRQLGLKVFDPQFDQYAVHSWFAGYDRSALPNPDHIHIHFLPQTGTWVWQIPISDEVTSIGVVTQKRAFKAAGGEREEFFHASVASKADVGALCARAERVRPFTEEADYSYAMKQFAGDRWVLIGDAARFVDPIFSSGVSIALNSARFASADVIAALESGRFERSSYQRFESTIRRGVKNWYDFICLYYRLNVLFTYFVNHPYYRLDVLKLLQGEMYDEDEPPVITKMREKIRQVEANPDHMWHAFLGDVRADGLAAPTRERTP
jgi:FADH2 O2-dependent halogenase